MNILRRLYFFSFLSFAFTFLVMPAFAGKSDMVFLVKSMSVIQYVHVSDKTAQINVSDLSDGKVRIKFSVKAGAKVKASFSSPVRVFHSNVNVTLVVDDDVLEGNTTNLAVMRKEGVQPLLKSSILVFESHKDECWGISADGFYEQPYQGEGQDVFYLVPLEGVRSMGPIDSVPHCEITGNLKVKKESINANTQSYILDLVMAAPKKSKRKKRSCESVTALSAPPVSLVFSAGLKRSSSERNLPSSVDTRVQTGSIPPAVPAPRQGGSMNAPEEKYSTIEELGVLTSGLQLQANVTGDMSRSRSAGCLAEGAREKVPEQVKGHAEGYKKGKGNPGGGIPPRRLSHDDSHDSRDRNKNQPAYPHRTSTISSTSSARSRGDSSASQSSIAGRLGDIPQVFAEEDTVEEYIKLETPIVGTVCQQTGAGGAVCHTISLVHGEGILAIKTSTEGVTLVIHGRLEGQFLTDTRSNPNFVGSDPRIITEQHPPEKVECTTGAGKRPFPVFMVKQPSTDGAQQPQYMNLQQAQAEVKSTTPSPGSRADSKPVPRPRANVQKATESL